MHQRRVQICQDHPSLSLAQAYAVIGFYLANHSAVDGHLTRQDRADRTLGRELRARQREVLADLRRRLQARRRTGPHVA